MRDRCRWRSPLTKMTSSAASCAGCVKVQRMRQPFCFAINVMPVIIALVLIPRSHQFLLVCGFAPGVRAPVLKLEIRTWIRILMIMHVMCVEVLMMSIHFCFATNVMTVITAPVLSALSEEYPVGNGCALVVRTPMWITIKTIQITVNVFRVADELHNF